MATYLFLTILSPNKNCNVIEMYVPEICEYLKFHLPNFKIHIYSNLRPILKATTTFLWVIEADRLISDLFHLIT